MKSAEDAWREVGAQFEKLGSLFQEHYDARGEEGAEVPSEEDVAEAVRVLGESVKAALGAVGDTVTDPAVRDEARRTAGTFFDALAATFSELGEEIAGGRESEDS